MVGLYQLSRAAGWLKKRFTARAAILMYHSVAEVNSDPWRLRVRPDYFAEQLAVLREYAQPMSLQQLVQTHQVGKLPHRAVVVTFDDGYADNLYSAKPLLEQYDVPATVFLASGYLGGEREFWWDELDRLLLQPGHLPQTLCMKIAGRTHRWDLGQAAYYSEADARRERRQSIWEAEPGSRLAFYYSVWQLLRFLPDDQRQRKLEEIRLWAGAEQAVRATHRALTLAEVPLLGQGDLIELGAHTVTHPFLSAHPAALQAEEIRQSKARVEDILNHQVSSFSYPHGDYTYETVQLIEAAGFNCACSVVAESAWRNSDRFQLPRFEVQDWSGEEFRKRLLYWFYN